MWKKFGKYPWGLKADLAKITPLELPRNEELLVRYDSERATSITLSRSGVVDKLYLRRWDFPSPFAWRGEGLKWQQGFRVAISPTSSSLFRAGFERLLRIPQQDFPSYRNLYLYEIKYGRMRSCSYRFYINFCKRWGWRYLIQRFVLGKDGTYIPSVGGISFEHERREGLHTASECLQSIGKHLELFEESCRHAFQGPTEAHEEAVIVNTDEEL